MVNKLVFNKKVPLDVSASEGGRSAAAIKTGKQERIRDRDFMRRELNNIWLASPDQALRGARSSLSQLSSAAQAKAVANGAFATWSYVRR